MFKVFDPGRCVEQREFIVVMDQVASHALQFSGLLASAAIWVPVTRTGLRCLFLISPSLFVQLS